jgi:hypothetical protein
MCFWGQQTCTPSGSWGKCVETGVGPGSCPPGGYDLTCCVASGACCEDPMSKDDSSVGICAGAKGNHPCN